MSRFLEAYYALTPLRVPSGPVGSLNRSPWRHWVWVAHISITRSSTFTDTGAEHCRGGPATHAENLAHNSMTCVPWRFQRHYLTLNIREGWTTLGSKAITSSTTNNKFPSIEIPSFMVLCFDVCTPAISNIKRKLSWRLAGDCYVYYSFTGSSCNSILFIVQWCLIRKRSSSGWSPYPSRLATLLWPQRGDRPACIEVLYHTVG